MTRNVFPSCLFDGTRCDLNRWPLGRQEEVRVGVFGYSTARVVYTKNTSDPIHSSRSRYHYSGISHGQEPYSDHTNKRQAAVMVTLPAVVATHLTMCEPLRERAIHSAEYSVNTRQRPSSSLNHDGKRLPRHSILLAKKCLVGSSLLVHHFFCCRLSAQTCHYCFLTPTFVYQKIVSSKNSPSECRWITSIKNLGTESMEV